MTNVLQTPQGGLKANPIPANLGLMRLTPQRLALLKPVTTLDINEGTGNNFHEEGLFSTTIFGRIGSDRRDTQFSYIDIKAPVFHPLFFKHLTKLKGLYADILAGKAYATFNEEQKDFVQSDELSGETGFSFFVEHFPKIEFKETGSDIREIRIKFINKWKSEALTDKILVLPAGLRDVNADPNGRLDIPEINDFYRGIISVANSIGGNADFTSSIYDVSRYTLQMKFNGLFEFIQGLLSGKKGFLQNRWAKRRIFNGTRNVITAMDTSASHLEAPNSIDSNHTIVGVYQTAKAALPLTIYCLRTGFISQVFNTHDGHARLVDPKTLQSTLVHVSAETIDRWTKSDGLEKVVNLLSKPSLRGQVIDVEGHYMGLIYTGNVPRPNFKIFSDIRDLPESFDKKDVRPLTLIELIYLSCYERWHEAYAFITRYPVASEGSTYPSAPYVKTTIVGEVRYELDDNWEYNEEFNRVAPEFPKRDMDTYVESLIVATNRLGQLGGDFDGDMCSFNMVYSTNAIAEVKAFLASKRAYVNAEGEISANPITDTVEYVLFNLTA